MMTICGESGRLLINQLIYKMSETTLFSEIKIMELDPKSKSSFPRKDEALTLMHRVAKQVSPIMKKRGWKVKSLIEIFPKDESLQGYNRNRGELIALRLRSHRSSSTILPWEHVLGTMLHELSHIIFGPHDQKFYNLLDELTKECDELQSRGIIGLGPFDCEGFRSGGLSRSSLEMKEIMLNKALQRQKISSLMGSGRLGGAAGATGKSLRELAAEAAERRARDDAWCGTDKSDEGDFVPLPSASADCIAGRSKFGSHATFLACSCGCRSSAQCRTQPLSATAALPEMDAREKRPRDGHAVHAAAANRPGSGPGMDPPSHRRRAVGSGPAPSGGSGSVVVDLTGGASISARLARAPAFSVRLFRADFRRVC
jgi:hypothetical protein